MWENLLFLGIGLLIGGVSGWLWAGRRAAGLQADAAADKRTADELRHQITQQAEALTTAREKLDVERQSRVEMETRLQETAKRFEEQQCLLAEQEKKLRESFKSLSAEALHANAEQFLSSAKKTLDVILTDAKGDLGKRQEAINTLVKPLSESLKRYDEHIRSLEQVRQKAYGSLEEQVKALAVTNQQLQQETGKLVTSLRDPKVRGRWGEIALQRAVELAGMSEHCDFDEQVSVAGGEDNRLRPDMVVHLPGGRTVAVDAKAVLDAYLSAVAAGDEEERSAHLKRHASQIRSRVRELSSKAYWDRLPATPEFVVLFLPGESFFSAAVDVDRALIEDAISQRVVLASPTTLIALLRAVAFGWRQEQFAQNAERIRELGAEIYDRMRTLMEHVGRIGGGLGRAVEAYNQAVGSLETRLLPTARKFKELGAAAGSDIPELEPIDRTPRQLDTSQIDER